MEALILADTLVTYNGTLFDLRFLKKTLGEFVILPVHIDLRYLAKRVGLVGGQRGIERTQGLPERVGMGNMDGAEAVLLWHRYLRGDEAALRRLIDYNRCDVVGMCGILDEVMDRLDLHPDLLFRRAKFAESAYTTFSQAIGYIKSPRREEKSNFSCAFDDLFGGICSPARDCCWH